MFSLQELYAACKKEVGELREELRELEKAYSKAQGKVEEDVGAAGKFLGDGYNQGMNAVWKDARHGGRAVAEWRLKEALGSFGSSSVRFCLLV